MTTRPSVFVGLVASLAIALALSLHLNLRSWRVAADIAILTRTEIVEGRPAGELVKSWAARNGVELTSRGAIPHDHRGVGIFVNGYEELVRLLEPKPQAPNLKPSDQPPISP